MRDLPLRALPAWALVVFFLIGAFGNIFVSAEIAGEYRRWGYPDGFHYVTGALELTTAGLLIFRRTRLWGVALACVVMLGAAATVLVHGEYAHAVAPCLVLALLILTGRLARQDLRRGMRRPVTDQPVTK